MASAWGSSWGSAWGNSWGSIEAVVEPDNPHAGGQTGGRSQAYFGRGAIGDPGGPKPEDLERLREAIEREFGETEQQRIAALKAALEADEAVISKASRDLIAGLEAKAGSMEAGMAELAELTAWLQARQDARRDEQARLNAEAMMFLLMAAA